MKLIPKVALVLALVAPAVASIVMNQQPASAQAPAIEPLHFHHVHLNSVDPKAASEYYPEAVCKVGDEDDVQRVRSGEDRQRLHSLHEGEHTADQRIDGTADLGVALRLEHAQLARVRHELPEDGPDDRADVGRLGADGASSSTCRATCRRRPGGFPTQEQILELRAKGAKVDPAATAGGFGYLRGPDGVMIENAQAGTTERFNHVHMYHEHPSCAMEWYVTHLGARAPQGRGGAGRAAMPRRPARSGDVGGLPQSQNRLLAADVPVVREGRLRARSRRRRELRRHLDLDSTVAGRRPASARAGKLYDHWALSTADLDKTVTRLKGEGVKFLEEIHPWGTIARRDDRRDPIASPSSWWK